MSAGGTVKERYTRYETERTTFLERARKCAELTIPTLLPPDGHSSSTTYYTPWQGVGARGVNNLASKLLLSLLPPNSPFFRFAIDDFTMEEITGQKGMRAQVEKGLSKAERAIMAKMERMGLRPHVFASLKHLLVSGNVILYLPKENDAVRVYRLDSFTVKRDLNGNVLEVICKDEVSPLSLSDDEREYLNESSMSSPAKDEGADRNVEVYTRMYRDGPNWHLCQEINGKEVEGSRGKWPLEKSPMLVLRWTSIDGEDYGRSYVEEYLGDLISLEGLSKAIVEASAVAAKVVYLVNPNGITDAADLTRAESGDVIAGREEDVSALQSEKQADMRIAYEAASRLTDRLSQAFLLASSVQRQAERVTAEEIRVMASELEDALGGVYSLLSQEFQLPLVRRVMDIMVKGKELPKLPEGIVTPQIVTGLDALGRGHDLQKYRLFMETIAPLGPEAVAQFMNVPDFIERIATSLGIDSDGLVKGPDQLQQEQEAAQEQQEQAMMAEMTNKLGPAGIKATADMAQAQAAMDQQG
jgi:hypothetical protein